ncbi:MAG: hypothetical protein U1F47_05200 [Hyphomicrobiales bacterium]
MDEDRRAFYEYHALMEPWDGPAAMVFTDGRLIGATLLIAMACASRYMTSADGHVLLASEMGCPQFAEGEHHPQVAPAAGQDAYHRPRAEARIISDEEPRSSWPRHIPTRSGRSARRWCCATRRPRRRGAPAARSPCSTASRPSATRRKT